MIYIPHSKHDKEGSRSGRSPFHRSTRNCRATQPPSFWAYDLNYTGIGCGGTQASLYSKHVSALIWNDLHINFPVHIIIGYLFIDRTYHRYGIIDSDIWSAMHKQWDGTVMPHSKSKKHIVKCSLVAFINTFSVSFFFTFINAKFFSKNDRYCS